MRFSVAALVSFSEFPLRLGIFTGIFAALIGLAVMIYTIVTKILYDAPSGYSTIIVVMCFMFALLFCLLGIIGEYIAVLFREVKGAADLHCAKNRQCLKTARIFRRDDLEPCKNRARKPMDLEVRPPVCGVAGAVLSVPLFPRRLGLGQPIWRRPPGARGSRAITGAIWET